MSAHRITPKSLDIIPLWLRFLTYLTQNALSKIDIINFDLVLNVDISGPTSICAGSGFGFYNVSYNIYQSSPPYTFLWEVSPNGISGFTTLGTSQSLPFVLPANLPSPFFIRVTVTDAGGKTGTDMIPVFINNCIDEGSDDRNDQIMAEIGANTLYPNPVTNSLTIQPDSGASSYELYHTNGTLIKSGTINGQGEKFILDMSVLLPGTYFVRITGKHNTFTHKLIKQ